MHINRINEGTVFRQANIRKTSLLSMFSCYNSTDYKNALNINSKPLLEKANSSVLYPHFSFYNEVKDKFLNLSTKDLKKLNKFV